MKELKRRAKRVHNVAAFKDIFAVASNLAGRRADKNRQFYQYGYLRVSLGTRYGRRSARTHFEVRGDRRGSGSARILSDPP
jgi:hypothetical protein